MAQRTELTEDDRKLIEAAKETAKKLHVDHFHEVAAAIRTKCGRIFTGIHTEARFDFASICGEGAAISVAVSNGYRDFDSIVAVWSKDGKEPFSILSPCGKCRELICFLNPNIWVIVNTPEDPYKVKVSDLLPLKTV